MKNKLAITLLLPALLLTSCIFAKAKETEEREIEVYDLDNIPHKGDIVTGAGYQTTIKARFVKGQDYIPYLTITDYISLYEPHFKKSIISEVEIDSGDYVWTVKEGKEYHFVAEFDMYNRALLMAGGLSSAYRDDDNQQDVEALEHGLKSDYEADESGRGYAVYYFSSIDCFKYNSEWYLPLGLLDTLLSADTQIYYFYNYAHIFSTKDVDNFATKQYIDETKIQTVDSQMQSKTWGRSGDMPDYLIDYNAKLFILLMNYFYGLKDNKGISSMTLYYKNNNLYSGLFSHNASIRSQTYADCLDCFDDNHTALVSVNNAWGEENYIVRRLSKGIASRNRLRQQLNSTRDAYYAQLFTDKEVEPGDEIVYSQDGKTAMYMFNSFSFTTSDVLNGDNLEKLYQEDTYFNLIHIFEAIKAKGGVQNVILDISTNGGGTVGVMVKLLALLSKDNKTRVTYLEGASSQIVSMHVSVDSNDDEEYDANDCYGNDFNFYILTSDCSFSCGNAFPCVAQLEGSAKIIGQKSGGGECAINIHYLPNSQYVYHSSTLHLGNYDKVNKEFVGFEGGAKPDIEIQNEADFYDIEKLNNFIANA